MFSVTEGEIYGDDVFWQDKNVALFNANSFDLFELISPKVDSLLSDPPYLVHAGEGGGAFGKIDSLVNTGGFTDAGIDYSFIKHFKNWCLFCSKRQLIELLSIANSFKKWNLITWAKPNPVPTCNNKYLPDVEYIVHVWDPGNLFGSYYEKQCFYHLLGKKTTKHPNEKPLALMTKLVLSCSKEGDTVFDPFMGSGTTGIACIRNNRKFIGIERDKQWYKVAKKRIQEDNTNLSGWFE